MLTAERKYELANRSRAAAFCTGFAGDTPLKLALVDLMLITDTPEEYRFASRILTSTHLHNARRYFAARDRNEGRPYVR
jgi:hypothetical protein